MAIVRLEFTKILVEKNSPAKGKIKVSNNAGISEVKKAAINVNMGSKKQIGMEILFSYVSSYDPKIGQIVIEGRIVFVGDEDKIQSNLSKWKDENKLDDDITKEVYNAILRKCNIEAIILSRDMNLPSPIPLPKIEEGN